MARVKQPRRTGYLLRPRQGGSADARPDKDGKNIFSLADDFRILEGLANYVAEHKKRPDRSKLHSALRGCARTKAEYTDTQIYEKVRRLRDWYFGKRDAGGVGDSATEVRKYELSTKIWGNEEAPGPAQPKLAKKRAAERRGFEEMRRLFPCLSATVEEIASGNNIMLGAAYKRAFELMDDEEAAELEGKVKKQKIKVAKMRSSRTTLTIQVVDMLIKCTD